MFMSMFKYTDIDQIHILKKSLAQEVTVIFMDFGERIEIKIVKIIYIFFFGQYQSFCVKIAIQLFSIEAH